MWVRGALFAFVLGGCYSPSFDSCYLACASNDVCPNGFECSNGRCAVEGSNCSPTSDGGDDGMPPDEMITFNCGNAVPEPGEFCFKDPIRIDTLTSDINATQLIDINVDGATDLVFLTPASYSSRLRTGPTTFGNVNVGGPVAVAKVMLGVDLGGNTLQELVHNDQTDGVLEILEWDGDSWEVGASVTSQVTASDARGIAHGATTGVAMQQTIAIAFPTVLRVFRLPTTALTPLVQQSSNFTLSSPKDVAIADTKSDNAGEIAVATSDGILLFTNINGTLVVQGTPDINDGVDAVEKCNIDGVTGDEIAYTIRKVGMPSTVGALRWNGTAYELIAPKSINNMLDPIACADFDRDGLQDAVVVGGDGAGQLAVQILRGRPNATFDDPVRFPVDLPGAGHIYIGRFNADDVPDIVVTSSATGIIAVLEANP
jgi:hypothetical protein